MDLAGIKEFWEQAGRAIDPDAAVTQTSRDPFLAELERQNVLAHLKPDDRALEVGCGMGVHTVHYARAVRSVTAIDIAPSLLKHAQNSVDAAGVHNVALVELSVLDLANRFERGSFDVVISQRCLINVPTWQHQQQALEQIANVLLPEGLLLLTEGFQQELEALNEIRMKVGLDPIRVVDFNRNLVHDEFDKEVARHFDIADRRDYGMYLLLSRVLHPLAVAPDQPRHESPINRAAMLVSQAVEVSALQMVSYDLFYALRRRSPLYAPN